MRATYRQQGSGLSPRPFPIALSLPYAFCLLLPIPGSQLPVIHPDSSCLGHTQLGCTCLSCLPRQKEPVEGDVQTQAENAGRGTERNQAVCT